MLLITGLLLTLVFALLFAAGLKISSRPAYILAIILLAYAEIVAISELASLLSMIGPVFYLTAHLILVLICFFLWQRAGYPSLFGPYQNCHFSFSSLIRTVRYHPWLSLLALGIGAAFLIGAVLIIRIPPNNYDAMTYHLARAAIWKQNKTLFPFPTADFRLTSFPVNSELSILWIFTLGGDDRWVGFIQWSAALVCMVAVYGLARLLGASRPQATFSALIWATLPEILLQSVSAQNDLIVTAFFACLVFFMFYWVTLKDKTAMFLSALAFGLSLGTKTTAMLALPGLGLAVLFLWWRTGRPGLARLLRWAVASLVAFFLFGALTFFQNLTYYGNLLGPSKIVGNTISMVGSQNDTYLFNSLILLYQARDPGSLPAWLAAPIDEARDWTFQQVTRRLNLPVEQILSPTGWTLAAFLNQGTQLTEDVSWFGFLGFLLLSLAALWQGWSGIRNRDPLRLGLFAIALTFFITISITLAWSPYRGRYFVLPATLTAPLLAYFYHQKKGAGQIINGLLILLALFEVGFTMVNNPAKPLFAGILFWSQDRIGRQTVTNPSIAPVLRMVEQHIPEDARLAVRVGEDDWLYPLFGPRLTRTVFEANPDKLSIVPASISADYLLIEPRQRPFLALPDGLRYIDQAKGWILFALDPTAQSKTAPPELLQTITGASDPFHFYSVTDPLVGKVGIVWLYPLSWKIEEYQGRDFLWLGEGLRQGLKGYLWSEEDRSVTIRLSLEPGPGRTDAQRSLAFRFLQSVVFGYLKEGDIFETSTFDKPVDLEFRVQLHHGLNEFWVWMEDIATVRKQPGGDMRPLLAILRQIQVRP